MTVICVITHDTALVQMTDGLQAPQTQSNILPTTSQRRGKFRTPEPMEYPQTDWRYV